MLFFENNAVNEAQKLLFNQAKGETDSAHRLLEFRNVSVKRPGGTQLVNLNLSIGQGENVVVLGPEGSGKDLFSDLVTCKIKPDQGEVFFLGQNIHEKEGDELETYRSCIAYVSYNFGLINNLSIIDNVILPLRYHTSLSETELVKRAESFLQRFQLMHVRDLRPQMVRHSEALRAAFARAMILQPMLVFIDHAFASQCPIALSKFLDSAREEFADKQITFLMTSFEYGYFHRHTQRYLLLYEGQVVFRGSREDLERAENPYIRQFTQTPLEGPMQSFM